MRYSNLFKKSLSVLVLLSLTSCSGMLTNKNVDLANANDINEEQELIADTSKVILKEELDIALKDDLLSNKIKSYSIQNTGPNSNYFVAEVENLGFYSLRKTAPSEYILTLSKTSSEEQNEKVLMAEKGSGKIRSARLQNVDGDLQIRIFSEPDATLKAKTEGDKIIVAIDNDFINLENVRAQSEDVEQANAEAEIDEDLSGFEEELGSLFESKYTGRLISLDLQDTGIDNALRIIAEVSNLNIIASDDVTGKVTLRLIDVPWDQALDVILKTNGLDMVREGNVVRIAPVEKLRSEREALKQARQAEEELEPLSVQYIRISYAKAAELQPLIESVLSERGSVTFDDRTNQLIIQDITKGIKNAQKLVQKVDLRTPQVLIESQIVEATRTFTRRLGFSFLRTPETGNALGYNFPNSLEIGGSALDAAGQAIPGAVSSFPNGESSAVSFLFGSADGTKNLDLRLSQAETEGIAKIISKPSVAVTNNTPAVIKSVRKIRIKLPQGGGVNIGVGAGAAGGGGGTVATETIEVGIILNVTAQASPDYFVLMDIDAKSSTLGSNEDSVDQIPPEIERSATSSVLVSSGQTFAMGGIYRIDENNDVAGMPFFKDIPVIGHFFRSSTVRDSDQELLFFLTPRIIEGSFDDATMQAAS